MFFQSVGEHEAPLQQTFEWLAPNNKGTHLTVRLEFVSPDTLNREQKEQQSLVMGQRRYNAVTDLEAEATDTMRRFNRILASRVLSIDNMTVRKLSELVQLNMAALRAAGVGPDDKIDMDPSDGTALTPDERAKFNVPAEVQTRGQLAAGNILYLMQGNQQFQSFVHGAIQDVGLFQDKKWWGEEQVKNSESGGGTSTAQP